MTAVNHAVASSQLLASRFDLEVIPLAFATSFEDLDRPSVRKLIVTLATALRLAVALWRRRPDAVYFTLVPAGAAFYRDCLFVAITKLAGVPRIYHLHGKTRPDAGALHRWALRGASIIHLSERLAADIRTIAAGRILVVANGVPDRSPPDRRERRGRVRLLFLSNMTESKGPLVLIAALGMLRVAGVEFVATFAGAVHERRFLDRCHAEIRRHRLERYVSYIGPAYGERKQRAFDDHDIFVLPTRNDAFPLVVLEAMQAGIAVVATREGALPEIIEDGQSGLLVPPGDAVALANCLGTLIPDRALQGRLGANGRQRYLSTYTQAAFEQNLADALTTCIEAQTISPAGGTP